MGGKPTTAAGYAEGQAELVLRTCLYVATKLGDLMEDIVVVGGLAPFLLVDQASLPKGADAHVGTMDLDIGLAAAVLNRKRYEAVAERLRRAGFEPDVNERGRRTRQRWIVQTKGDRAVTVDFLIAPTRSGEREGRLKSLERDFAAVVTRGLRLAFRDRKRIPLTGKTIVGERARREVWVCGAAAFVILKALAFRNRGENKDAYDLFYVIRNYGAGPEDVATAMRALGHEPEAKEAMSILRDDFCERDAAGCVRVAQFLTGDRNPTIEADVAGFVHRFVEGCRRAARKRPGS